MFGRKCARYAYLTSGTNRDIGRALARQSCSLIHILLAVINRQMEILLFWDYQTGFTVFVVFSNMVTRILGGIKHRIYLPFGYLLNELLQKWTSRDCGVVNLCWCIRWTKLWRQNLTSRDWHEKRLAPIRLIKAVYIRALSPWGNNRNVLFEKQRNGEQQVFVGECLYRCG